MKLALLAFLPVLLAQPASTDQIKKVTDKETGLVVTYVTSEPCVNAAAYPTCKTWSRDGKYIFIESTRPRPDGANQPKERQLLKVDTHTGKATHLATLAAEDTKPYGVAQITISTQYHFDYAEEANVLVYYDITGHNLYLLNPDTGESKLILHEPEGTIGDPPAITPDGKRVVYYAIFPSIENRFLGRATSVVFALDVDPAKLEAIGEPKIITAYPWRNTKPLAGQQMKGVIVCHSQVNPKNSDHYCFAHQFHGLPDQPSLTFTRTWQNINGIDKPVYVSPKGEWETHEVIGPLGKSLYFMQRWGVYSADFKSGKKRTIYENKEGLNPCHISVSPDEKWIAADMWNDMTPDENGCFASGILLIETETGKSKVLCRILRGNHHPRHPHPNFSPDGKKIAFTVADGKNNSQVAYVDISDVIKNWNKGR